MLLIFLSSFSFLNPQCFGVVLFCSCSKMGIIDSCLSLQSVCFHVFQMQYFDTALPATAADLSFLLLYSSMASILPFLCFQSVQSAPVPCNEMLYDVLQRLYSVFFASADISLTNAFPPLTGFNELHYMRHWEFHN